MTYVHVMRMDNLKFRLRQDTGFFVHRHPGEFRSNKLPESDRNLEIRSN